MEYSFEVGDEVKQKIKEIYDGTETSIFLIVEYLRETGYFQMQSIFLIAGELEINLMEANRLFLKSRVWAAD